MIEAKVESGFGHGQRANQKTVARLMKMLIPCFKDPNVLNMTLICGGEGLRWLDVVAMLNDPEIEQFSMACMAQVSRLGT